jgi:hypothetical protein
MSFPYFYKQQQNILPFDDSSSKNYIDQQSEILKSQNQKNIGMIPDGIERIPHSDIAQTARYGIQKQVPVSNKNDPYHSYDPFFHFLQNRGLLKENFNARLHTTYLHVDSGSRTTVPLLVTENETTLSSNPLTFTSASINIGITSTTQNLITANYSNNNLKAGDRIILNNISTSSISMNSNYNFGVNLGYTVVFTQNSFSVAFVAQFNSTPSTPIFNPNFSVGNGISFTTLQNYDTSKLFVNISGFTVNPSTGTPTVGNIPINFLNGVHRVYFTNPDYTIYNGVTTYTADTLINIPVNGTVSSITGFYILLPTRFNGSQPTYNMVINMQFRYIGGIPLNELNAEFPIDENHTLGYQTVYSASSSVVNIAINTIPYYFSSGTNAPPISFGGSGVYISKVTKIETGYNSPSAYQITLPRTIQHVIMAKMIDSAFPNTLYSFSGNPLSQNNKIYWQNLDDGDVTYSTLIPPGNYDATSLSAVFLSQVNTISRQNITQFAIGTTYTPLNYMTMVVNTNTNDVTISAFKYAKLTKPVKGFNPPIPLTGDGTPPYTVTIFQASHGLYVGNKITLSGLISTGGVPASVLNGVHTITNIPNGDNYEFVIDAFNLNDPPRTDTGGGYGATAYVPIFFKLLFTYSDTLGNQLGFRNVGKSTSITPYNTVISNNDAYLNETVITDNDGFKYIMDQSGNKQLLKCNALKFNGDTNPKILTDDYIYMYINEFRNITNVGALSNPKKFFAKINMSGLIGAMLYNTFSSFPAILYDPVNIDFLNISFLNKFGASVDFNGVEHSYMLEITSIDYTPNDTDTVGDSTVF